MAIRDLYEDQKRIDQMSVGETIDVIGVCERGTHKFSCAVTKDQGEYTLLFHAEPMRPGSLPFRVKKKVGNVKFVASKIDNF